jgi:hypothetical protein
MVSIERLKKRHSITHSNQDGGESGEDGEGEEDADDLGRGLHGGPELVDDLLALAVAQGGGVALGGGAVVAVVDGDLEEAVRLEGLGGAEGADDDAGGEGSGGDAVLDGEVLLGLRGETSASGLKPWGIS